MNNSLLKEHIIEATVSLFKFISNPHHYTLPVMYNESEAYPALFRCVSLERTEYIFLTLPKQVQVMQVRTAKWRSSESEIYRVTCSFFAEKQVTRVTQKVTLNLTAPEGEQGRAVSNLVSSVVFPPAIAELPKHCVLRTFQSWSWVWRWLHFNVSPVVVYIEKIARLSVARCLYSTSPILTRTGTG